MATGRPAEYKQKWKFAVFHHPAYQDFDDSKTVDDAIREHWVPILEQYQVDMVFVGHQHVYMRTHPIFRGEVANDSNGIVYVMGNSGSKEYALGQGFPYIACEETGSNYQLIAIEGDVLTLTSRKADGELIETYAIYKGTFQLRRIRDTQLFLMLPRHIPRAAMKMVSAP